MEEYERVESDKRFVPSNEEIIILDENWEHWETPMKLCVSTLVLIVPCRLYAQRAGPTSRCNRRRKAWRW